MKRLRPAFLFSLLLFSTGCTTAGPFVTSISSDGRGGLIVEKSMVKFNSFTGTVSNENSTTTTIKISSPSREASPAAAVPREVGADR